MVPSLVYAIVPTLGQDRDKFIYITSYTGTYDDHRIGLLMVNVSCDLVPDAGSPSYLRKGLLINQLRKPVTVECQEEKSNCIQLTSPLEKHLHMLMTIGVHRHICVIKF